MRLDSVTFQSDRKVSKTARGVTKAVKGRLAVAVAVAVVAVAEGSGWRKQKDVTVRLVT